MYRMIVVDDEAAITDWLEQAISEHFVGKVEVYKAYSADECLDLMAMGSFHILLTDISMPLVSGLDLLKAVSVYYPKTKKLALSAHDNFEYAKRAIDFEVTAYVLKSEGDEVLFEAMEKAIAEAESDQELFSLTEKLKLQSQKWEGAIKNSHLQRLLFGEIGLDELAARVDGSLDFSRPVEMALLAIDVRDVSRRAFALMALEASLAEFLKPHFTYEMVETGVSEVTLLAQFKNVAEVYGEAAIFLKSLFVMYENTQESYYRLTDQYVNIIYSTQAVSAASLHAKYIQFKETMQKCRDLDCSILLPETTEYEASYSSHATNGISREIGILLKYIHQNMDKDLSLIRLADVAYLNSSYLSHLFKQQVGMNLSDYVKVERIRICKEMLTNPKYKIHEIARNVGYDNASYFSRFFKKMTGITPQEYRKHLSIE
ncbi:response regulator transcription factor [Cohnella herbarum]|uniref:Helix-turn-helix domain-containing protein n=1 Tax=Cohnella herbarum TaxID=2728023 RepID=A0A7Z2VKG4_9BACL|nr:helix-turn-helix domain-containing protein [Cohnella herbarum]QJD84687.1 helix-turn-helix domain-containing protein [Cohnella herbarum]